MKKLVTEANLDRALLRSLHEQTLATVPGGRPASRLTADVLWWRLAVDDEPASCDETEVDRAA
jgi:hypothetical protein